MGHEKQLGELTEIEMHLIEIRNLFTDLFQHMVMSSKGLMGFAVNSSQLKAMAAFHEDRRYSMGELCKIAKVKMPSMTVVEARENELMNIFGCLDEKQRTRLLKSLRAASSVMKHVSGHYKAQGGDACAR
jgi:hypothetical protein